MNTKKENYYNLIKRLENAGFSFEEANQLRRIEMTLQRWSELECGNVNDYSSWAIVRDEETEIPYMEIHPHTSNDVQLYKIADREKGALKRLAKIMEAHPDFQAYHQGDPRGCALYIVKKSDLNGSDIHGNYTRGIAVCD